MHGWGFYCEDKQHGTRQAARETWKNVLAIGERHESSWSKLSDGINNSISAKIAETLLLRNSPVWEKGVYYGKGI